MTEDLHEIQILENDIDDVIDNGVANNVEVNVFPNPASDYISIGGVDVKSFASVIINKSGQIIRTILIDEEGSSTNHIDLSSNPNGMYYILLRSKRKELNKSLKFIKM